MVKVTVAHTEVVNRKGVVVTKDHFVPENRVEAFEARLPQTHWIQDESPVRF